MSDLPEKKNETEDVEADFEGHVHGDPQVHGVKSASDEGDADFEGHSMDMRGVKSVKSVKSAKA